MKASPQRPGAFSLLRTRVARRLILALMLAGTLPLMAALAVAFALLEFSIGVGLNQTVEEALADDVPLYGALFDAKKSEYRAVAKAVAVQLPAASTDGDLVKLLVHPELAQLAVESAPPQAPPLEDPSEEVDDAPAPRGRVRAHAQRQPPPAGRTFETVEQLAGGNVLRAVFHLPPHFDQGLARSRELTESYAAISRARGAITRGLLLTFLVVVVMVVIGSAVLALLIARSITRKVAILSEAAREAAGGNLTVRVDEHWYDELGELARTFNQMLGEISESRDRIVYLEKISGWQEVARRLAHEIKNPLTPMVLAVQELAEKVPPEPQAYARLVSTAREIVEEEATTLRRLVQEFSDFARLPDVQLEPTDLAAFVQEWAEGAKDVTSVAQLVVDVPPEPMMVSLDRNLFRGVLANLAHNAVEAQGVPMRGKAPEVVPDPLPSVVVRLMRSGASARLTVDDRGPGVVEAERTRIFEPYVTGKAHGTGLGLAMVKKVVLQHGGAVSVGEAPEGGASFRIRLPLVGGH